MTELPVSVANRCRNKSASGVWMDWSEIATRHAVLHQELPNLWRCAAPPPDFVRIATSIPSSLNEPAADQKRILTPPLPPIDDDLVKWLSIVKVSGRASGHRCRGRTTYWAAS